MDAQITVTRLDDSTDTLQVPAGVADARIFVAMIAKANGVWTGQTWTPVSHI